MDVAVSPNRSPELENCTNVFSWILSIVVSGQHRQVGRWFREYGSGKTVPVACCSMADCTVDSVHFTPRCRICGYNRHCLKVCDLFPRRRDKNQRERKGP